MRSSATRPAARQGSCLGNRLETRASQTPGADQRPPTPEARELVTSSVDQRECHTSGDLLSPASAGDDSRCHALINTRRLPSRVKAFHRAGKRSGRTTIDTHPASVLAEVEFGDPLREKRAQRVDVDVVEGEIDIPASTCARSWLRRPGCGRSVRPSPDRRAGPSRSRLVARSR
jgi:hypothetical protein